jgi:hypothetical protein
MAVKIIGVEWHKREPKLLLAIVDFGDGIEREIPLPAHFVSEDDGATLVIEAARGMESLAEALLEYAGRIREPEESFGARM